MNREQLIHDLIRDEGIEYSPYKDTEGILTIGVGHNLEAGPIPHKAVIEILNSDIDTVFVELHRAFPWWEALKQEWRDALANMCFNLGITRLRGFKKMLAALEAGDGETAAIEALDSKWAKQVGERAERIADIYRS